MEDHEHLHNHGALGMNDMPHVRVIPPLVLVDSYANFFWAQTELTLCFLILVLTGGKGDNMR